MESHRACFGLLDNVFPAGDDGLREVPDQCVSCEDKISCLRAALASEQGIELRRVRAEKAGRVGLVGRLMRWSELKSLAREREKVRKGTG